MNTMGDRIRTKREENGWTMAELGAILGVQASAVNKWEKGHVSNIKRSTISQMARLFDVSPVWLMGLDDSVMHFDIETPDMKGVDHIRVEIPTLSPDECKIIQKYRADENFRNVVKALNGYDETIPVLKATPLPNVSNEIPVLKKTAKIKKRKDELV